MRRNRSESGSAGVEFALVLPILAVLACAIADYGQAVNLGTELNSAARAGAQYAIMHPSDSGGITWAAQNATKEPSSGMTVNVATSSDSGGTTLPYYCTCDSGDPTVSAVNCDGTGTCATGTKKFFVGITTTRTYTPILPYPGLATSISMTGTAIMQMQ